MYSGILSLHLVIGFAMDCLIDCLWGGYWIQYKLELVALKGLCLAVVNIDSKQIKRIYGLHVLDVRTFTILMLSG